MARLIYISLFFVFIHLSVNSQTDTFNIVFSHDFDNNSLGYYSKDTIEEDWNVETGQEYIHNDSVRIEDCDDAEHTSRVLRVLYEEGDYGASGGAQWELPFSPSHEELYFMYRFKLSEDFYIPDGVKMHSFNGYPQIDPCEYPAEDDGFEVYIVMHAYNGPQFMPYFYHQDQTQECGELKETGQAVVDNEWHSLCFRLVMNSVSAPGSGNYDGVMEIFYDSIQVYTKSNIRWRNYESIEIDWFTFSTFFGGGEGESPVKDEEAWFDDFFIFYFEPGIDTIVYGNNAGQNGRGLPLPPITAQEEEEEYTPVCTTYEYYIGDDDYSHNVYTDPFQLNEGHSFTVGSVGENSDFIIDSLRIKGYRVGDPGIMTVCIFDADNDTLPITSDTLAQGTFDADIITTSSNGEWINISLDGCVLEADSMYIFTISGGGENDVDEFMWIGDYYGTYPGGCNVNDGDGEWTTYKNIDYSFEICGHPSSGVYIEFFEQDNYLNGVLQSLFIRGQEVIKYRRKYTVYLNASSTNVKASTMNYTSSFY